MRDRTHLDTVAASSVEVVLCIQLHAIRDASINVCEHPTVLECLSFGVDVESVAVMRRSVLAVQLHGRGTYMVAGSV